MAKKANGHSEIKIEKGVPVPAPRKKYPLTDMGIGDSFLAPNTSAVRAGIYASAQRLRMKITLRKEGEGIRIWRIA